MLKMEKDVYMFHYKNWIKESCHWKTNQSRLYALILVHCQKAKFDWENEDIEEDKGLVEPDPNPATHPDILVEIPGVMMESNSDDVTTAIEAVPVPGFATQAAAARSNDNFTQNPGVPVRKITGVIKKRKTPANVIDDDEEWR